MAEILPTTPWSQNAAGRGPTWNNSLFEDTAEFGLGLRMAVDQKHSYAEYLLAQLSGDLGDTLVRELIESPQTTESGIRCSSASACIFYVKNCDGSIPRMPSCSRGSPIRWSALRLDRRRRRLGVRHRLRRTRPRTLLRPRCKHLVLDTGVYSNTGGQASKATFRGAVAKFASAGKEARKKDLGMIAVSYGNAYVGQVAMGANPAQTIRTFQEAESYPGPSLILAYSHCIAHGINMTTSMAHQKDAVNCGFWPLYHFDPRDAEPGRATVSLG